MHNRKLGGGRTRTNKRQASSPCPARNGTEIGTAQKFNLLCNTNLDGSILDSIEAFDLVACADLCSSFHPRCDGATFDGTTCQLKARLQPGRAPPSRRLDSVVGIFTSGTSNCGTLSGTQSTRGASFTPRCGTVIAGFDLSQAFAPTFQDCMGQCAAATGCAAVSYEATQDQGFKNCYLKTAVADATAVVPDARVDTAMVVGAANAVPGDTGVSTVPVPAPAPVAPAPGAATTGAVFFTPPGLNTAAPAAPTAAAPPVGTPGSSVVEVLPTGVASSPIAPPVFFPSSSSLAATGTAVPDSAAEQSGGSVSSNAWIAAPVVGSIAAIALIVLSFIMLKRRRAGARSPTSSSSSSGSLQRKGSGGRSRTSPVVTFFSSFLPSSSRNKGRSNNSRSSNSRMGNFSEVTGKQPASRASMRTSVTGLIGPGMRGMERLDDVDEERGEKRGSMTPSYEVRSGKMELRNSFNGLGQHRVS